MNRSRHRIVVLAIAALAGWAGAQAPRTCDLCGNPLGNRYWSTQDGRGTYCDSCRRTRPRCSLCDDLLGNDSREVRGRAVCPKCFRERPKCAECDLPILKTYYKVVGKAEEYCEFCHEGLPHCELCGRPYGGRYPVLRTRGKRCAACLIDAVTDEREVGRLYGSVREWMARDLKLPVSDSIPLHLVDRIEASAFSGAAGFKELGEFARRGDSSSIRVLRNLPRDLLVETLAHELAHAWQADRCPSGQSPVIREGFAQWVAAKALVRFGFEESVAPLADRPDLYGQGYRAVRSIESRRGEAGVLEYVQKTR